MLGMAPVGAADMKGYDTWVAAPRPRGMKDVGSRQSPSLERIAALRPDLIVVPDYRSTKNLSQLKKIAPVLVTHPYPATREPVRRDGHGLPAAGRRGRPRAARRAGAAGPQQHARAQQDEAAARRPGGRGGRDRHARRHEQRARDPHVHAELGRPPTSSAASGCATAGAGRARYGFATIGLEGLSRVSGWLAFVYPPQYARQVSGITRQSAYKRLPVVKAQARAHARRDDVAVRRPALDDAVRRAADGGADVA